LFSIASSPPHIVFHTVATVSDAMALTHVAASGQHSMQRVLEQLGLKAMWTARPSSP
jgi:hypothetical protein